MALLEDIVKFVSNKDKAASMLQVAALRLIVAGCRGEARWTGVEYPRSALRISNATSLRSRREGLHARQILKTYEKLGSRLPTVTMHECMELGS